MGSRHNGIDMAYRKHPIGQLIEQRPSLAIDKILDAYRRARCVQRDAAKLLRADETTFIRWVQKLQLQAAMTAMADSAKREGWFGSGRRIGRPPNKKKRGRRAAA